jgi:hypothetical protein
MHRNQWKRLLVARSKSAYEVSFSGIYQQQQELHESTAGIHHANEHKTDQPGQTVFDGWLHIVDSWKSWICPCAVFIH